MIMQSSLAKRKADFVARGFACQRRFLGVRLNKLVR
jgi:hypothetical protein